jgi:CRP-like cAMP-binding protein
MPNNARLRKILRNNEFFREISDTQLDALIPFIDEKPVSKGEFIIRENDTDDDLYVIIKGEMEVIKQEPVSGQWHSLALLSKGECIGEMALLDSGPRSASVRANSDCVVAHLQMKNLQIPPEIKQLSSVSLRLHFAKLLSKRLRVASGKTVSVLEAQVVEAKARVALGLLLCTLLVLNSGYVLSLQIAATLSTSSADTLYVSLPLLIFFGIGMYLAVRRSGYPLSMYGITFEGWQKSLAESAIFTLPLLLLIIIVKWTLIRYHPEMKQDHLFDLTRSFNLPGYQLFLIVILYAAFSAVQEMIVRGGIQSSFQHFLIGKHNRLIAILMANLMYSLSHIHLSLMVALLVSFPGFFWGWLYSRHRTVIGICVSHIFAGVFLFYVIGLRGLLH